MNVSKSTITGYGKIILLGEHAVVYGSPAIAAGLSRGVTLVRSEVCGAKIEISIPDWEIKAAEDDSDLFGKIISKASLMIGGDGGATFEFKSEIPISAGLGGSAALNVALVRAIASVRNLPITDSEVNRIAHELEKLVHGTPSGIDDTVATYGGVILYKRGDFDDLPEEITGRSLNDVAYRIDTQPLAFIVADSGVPKNTGEMVAGVRRFHDENPEAAKDIFSEISDIVIAGVRALSDNNTTRFGELMNENMEMLRKLELSHPKLDRMIEICNSAGALGAKLTGGGGGGSIIALAAENGDEIIRKLQGVAKNAWICTL
jgi:hydroxymethylglutaryl-CoA reductase